MLVLNSPPAWSSARRSDPRYTLFFSFSFPSVASSARTSFSALRIFPSSSSPLLSGPKHHDHPHVSKLTCPNTIPFKAGVSVITSQNTMPLDMEKSSC